VHLLKGQARGFSAGAEPVDLEQSAGEIVILTAADTEISGLAAARRSLTDAFPSVRLANWMQLSHPYSVDLYAEKVLAHARLVVIRLLGGGSYWRYGLDEAVRLARANGSDLLVLPGDATWDSGLAAEGTVPEETARHLWSYLVEGGSENLANALRFCAHLIGQRRRAGGRQAAAKLRRIRAASGARPSHRVAGEGGPRRKPGVG
jgi:cobaltochelatase CobN